MKGVDHHLLLGALVRHVGAENGAHAVVLAAAACGEVTPASLRNMRTAIEELRRNGHHICGTPEHGYFLAATPEELDRTCNFLYERAMTSLAQVAAMKRVSLPDLRGQLRLPLLTGSPRPQAALEGATDSNGAAR